MGTLVAVPALADHNIGHKELETGGGDPPSSQTPVSDSRPDELPPAPPPEGHYYAVRESGSDCWGIFWAPTPGSGERPGENGISTYDEWVDTIEGWGDDVCPGDDPAEPDMGTWMRAYWETYAPIGMPDPEIPPGWAITGKRSYLVIGGEREVEHSVHAPQPFDTQVRIRLSATYTVDWGDGVVESFDRSGVPWPGGPEEITHVYTDVGTYPVEVTATWTGSWDAGAWGGGDFPGSLERTSTLDLPVEEVQAVRQR